MAVVPYGVVMGSTQPVVIAGPVDENTGAVIVLDLEHYMIHAGRSFHTHFDNMTANSDGDQSAIGFKTPNTTKYGHPVITISASHPAKFYIFEGPTIDDDDGTPLVIANRYRPAPTASAMLQLVAAGTPGATSFTEAQVAAATLSGGLELQYHLLAGGEGPFEVGGLFRGEREWVLAPNTKYVFVMQNVGANANLHRIGLNWYEHANGNGGA